MKIDVCKDNGAIQVSARVIFDQNSGPIFEDSQIIVSLLRKMGAKVELVHWKKKMLRQVPVDVQVFVDHIFLENPSIVFPAKYSYLLVNYVHLRDWDLARLRDGSVIGLCKTEFVYAALQNLGVVSHLVGFGNHLDSFSDQKSVDEVFLSKIPGCVFHNGGENPLTGTLPLLEAWRIHIDGIENVWPSTPILIITAVDVDNLNRPLFNYWNLLHPKPSILPDHLLAKWPPHLKTPKFECAGSVFLCRESLSRELITFLQSISTAHACLNLIESWGRHIDEGRRNCAVLLVLDSPPMNQLVDASSGILIRASEGPHVQQFLPSKDLPWYPKSFFPVTYQVTVTDVGDALKRLLSLTVDQGKEFGGRARSNSFRDAELFTKSLQALFVDHLKNGYYYSVSFFSLLLWINIY